MNEDKEEEGEEENRRKRRRRNSKNRWNIRIGGNLGFEGGGSLIDWGRAIVERGT